MKTILWHLDKEHLDKDILTKAAAMIKADGLVAFPTETVYGLGANGLSNEAVQKIFAAKGRPSDNPLILHIADKSWVDKLAREIPITAKKLMQSFWPGPLTIVLKKQQGIPDAVTAGLDTVALRMPEHAVAFELIKLADLPIAAPSANTSGRPSPTNALAVIDDLWGKVDTIIDNDSTNIGLESTVVDCSEGIPTILRPGGITLEQLEKVVGKVNLAFDLAVEKPKSPGMKYKHYAPRASMYVFADEISDVSLINFIIRLKNIGLKTGALLNEAVLNQLPEGVFGLGGWQDEEDYNFFAANFYHWLRNFDEYNVDIIVARGVREQALGCAIMNRLYKASGLQRIDKESQLDDFFNKIMQKQE